MTQILNKLSKNKVVSSIFPASQLVTLSAQGTMGWFALKSARARENLTRYLTKNRKKNRKKATKFLTSNCNFKTTSKLQNFLFP